jgi:hypothetical protein
VAVGDPDLRVYVLADGSEIPFTWVNLKTGQIPWEALDDEELSKGRIRDKNGGFTGRGPDNIPRDMVAAQSRRLKERYDTIIRERLVDMVQAHMDIAMDENGDPKDRMKAMQYLQERVLGKVADKVELVAEVKPWQGLVEGVLTEAPDEPAD